MGKYYRCRSFAQVLRLDVILVPFGKCAFEQLLKRLLVVVAHLRFHLLLFRDKVVGSITVNPSEAGILELLLQHVHKVAVELAVHDQDIVAHVLCCLDAAVLGLRIGSVQIHRLLVFICLCALDGLPVVFE